MKLRDTLRLCLALPAIAMTGCAFRQPVTRMAVDYNQFVAEATNRQTALNILRARDREPLHFTSFTKVNGSVSGEASSSFDPGLKVPEIERTPDAAGKFGTTKRTFAGPTLAPSFGIKVNSGTDFEIAINSTDDFWKGILSPVQPSMVAYYLRQGWDPELLTYLFVDRVDFSIVVTPKPDKRTGKKGKPLDLGQNIVSLVNSPAGSATKPGQMSRFVEGVRCRPLGFDVAPASTSSLPLGAIGELANVPADILGNVKTAGAKTGNDEKDNDDDLPAAGSADPQSGSLVYETSTPESFGLTLGESNAGKCAATVKAITDAVVAALANSPAAPRRGESLIKAPVGRFKSTTRSQETARFDAIGGAKIKSEKFCNLMVNHDYDCNLQVAVTLRSIEGVIYYLGELQRNSALANPPLLKGSKTCTGVGGASTIYCIPILVVSENPKGPDTDLTVVEFKGRRYGVPSSGQVIDTAAGRSSEVLTLVEQLLNLYRSSKDFPVTPYVRVVN